MVSELDNRRLSVPGLSLRRFQGSVTQVRSAAAQEGSGNFLALAQPCPMLASPLSGEGQNIVFRGREKLCRGSLGGLEDLSRNLAKHRQTSSNLTKPCQTSPNLVRSRHTESSPACLLPLLAVSVAPLGSATQLSQVVEPVLLLLLPDLGQQITYRNPDGTGSLSAGERSYYARQTTILLEASLTSTVSLWSSARSSTRPR